MIRKSKILFITIAAASTCAFAGEKLMPIHPTELRTKAFAKKIDFDRAALNHVPSEKIVFDWKNVGIPDHLKGWKIVARDYLVLEGRRPGEKWEWSYTNDSEDVGIVVTSHKLGNQESLLAILNLANRSSSAEPPYVKGPADLGTVSVARPDNLVLYWAYRDLSFRVGSTNHEIARKTAYWLNSIAESHREPRN